MLYAVFETFKWSDVSSHFTLVQLCKQKDEAWIIVQYWGATHEIWTRPGGSFFLLRFFLATSAPFALADDYEAKLTGDQSVPPVQTSTVGEFELDINKELFSRSYADYTVSSNGPITGLRYVSLNLGQPGQAGEVIAYVLGPQNPTNVPSGRIVQGRLYADRFQGSFRGKSIGDLEDAVDDERVYGLISYETGALRGYFDD
eukprot:jgi/Botrbrau1/19160/Bobra.0077s0072.1